MKKEKAVPPSLRLPAALLGSGLALSLLLHVTLAFAGPASSLIPCAARKGAFFGPNTFILQCVLEKPTSWLCSYMHEFQGVIGFLASLLILAATAVSLGRTARFLRTFDSKNEIGSQNFCAFSFFVPVVHLFAPYLVIRSFVTVATKFTGDRMAKAFLADLRKYWLLVVISTAVWPLLVWAVLVLSSDGFSQSFYRHIGLAIGFTLFSVTLFLIFKLLSDLAWQTEQSRLRLGL